MYRLSVLSTLPIQATPSDPTPSSLLCLLSSHTPGLTQVISTPRAHSSHPGPADPHSLLTHSLLCSQSLCSPGGSLLSFNPLVLRTSTRPVRLLCLCVGKCFPALDEPLAGETVKVVLRWLPMTELTAAVELQKVGAAVTLMPLCDLLMLPRCFAE